MIARCLITNDVFDDILGHSSFFWCFDIGLEHIARSRGNGTNFDWLRKSCDISTCDLSPDGNPEKYGRPMKSAIKGGVGAVKPV